MLRETDPEHLHGTGHLFWSLLDVLDAERRRGRFYEDAVLFALFFLPIVRARVREAAPDGEPSPALLSTLLEDLVTPIAIRMALPHAVSHRIKQALAIVGKLSHRPDSRLAGPRLAFREAFPAALELFELRAMATGRGEELVARLARPGRARREDAAGLCGGGRFGPGTGRRPAPPPQARRAGGAARFRPSLSPEPFWLECVLSD